ncbi:MAG: DEAD/DEAH box helicase [Planctomycetes bacterium]|jgi:ATP-dependent RNA helicase RhlE|nr:DEAD/DEAH box helicase [Planctomycetota bacterium]
MKEETENQQADFISLGIAPSLLKVLDELGFIAPTPIQTRAIPPASAGQDIVGVAQTGTGKTLAFGLPMIQNIARQKAMGLVMLPTRELAIQVDENLRLVGAGLGLRTAVLIGGESFNRQLESLRRRPHIIVATPGRLIDHLGRGGLKLDRVKFLVLDEADMMLDMGFAPQIEEVLRSTPKNRQTMLFSATMPAAILRIAARHMKMPVHVEVAPSGTTVESVNQEMTILKRPDKFPELIKILVKYRGSVLIFARTKYGVKNLCRDLKKLNYEAAEIHSDRSLKERRLALEGFKDRRYRILVATDIAARGLDIKDIELVVNYDLPEQAEDYVHRIGRTARAGKSGTAVSFATPSQIGLVKQIENLVKKSFLPAVPATANSRPLFKKRRSFGPRRHF